tara:strand:+ start:432 stop:617 length:186 start_codon:yes stop_codon:yes gene_type:complete
MAKIIVEYSAEFKQTLDWPDDEMGALNLDNLQANLVPCEDDLVDYEFDIKKVKLNGKDHDF